MQLDAQKEIDQLNLLKTLVRVTGEIASARMQKARDAVLYRRYFLEKLMEVFAEVRRGFMHKFKRISQSSQGEDLGEVVRLAHNGKKVAVLLSANTRLYGDLLNRTFEEFFKDALAENTEATIVGRVGLNLFKERAPEKPVTYFELNDQDLEVEDLAQLSSHLVAYEEIHIYYGKYNNPVKQDADKFVISASMPLSKEVEEKPYVDYIFEPSLDEVLKFFETEIFNTMLEQTMIESQLAKFASRFVAMDRAQVMIEKEIKSLRVVVLKEKHKLQNKNQLNLMTPILNRMGGRS